MTIAVDWDVKQQTNKQTNAIFNQNFSIHSLVNKMLARKANSEDPDQTATSEAV